ncbi:MAG TPA: glycoside hydrolase domain-containing protein, partial [Puia sp.]|nr:glycoside hydrolase domain-containing protein [Puia sp.]
MQKLRILLILLAFSHLGQAQDIPYTSCPNCWNSDSLGNHRAVIRFDGIDNIVHARIPWRLPIADPFNHHIIVQDAQTGELIKSDIAFADRESGDIFFKPTSGKGIYYAYYLPYRNEGRSNYPKGIYQKPDTAANIPTITKINSTVSSFQSIDTFNTFYPMEVIATAKETSKLKAKYPNKPFLLFPEDREHPIRMQTDLPLRWIEQSPSISAIADIGEYFTFQIGVYALKDLKDIRLSFNAPFPITCVNTTGVTYDGHPFTNQINITKDHIQPLWCGIDIPKSAARGTYLVKVTVMPKNARPETVSFRLQTTFRYAADGGDPKKMTHLKWLNSTLAQENTVIAPYTPLSIQGDTLINLLGRSIQLSP